MGATELTLSVLGPVEAVVDGVPVDLGTRKQRALLARLVVAGDRTVSVDRLVDDLWGGQPPAQASASLQAYISNLRRVLEPGRRPGTPAMVLLTEAPGYRLHVAPEDVDAIRFVRLADRARTLVAAGDPSAARAAADEALALWHGPPLGEFADEPWAQHEVTRFEELHHGVVEDRLRALIDLGAENTAVAELEKLVQEYPWREGLWALLMLALYRAGRGADALARYQQVRTILGEELGLDPGPDLQDLERAILRQDPALRRPAAVPVPAADTEPRSPAPVPVADGPPPVADGTRLVGREDEVALLEEVAGRLGSHDPAWLLLEGEAGIGKTRLAEELAARAAARGVAVSWGRCHEDRDAPGFWPWLGALRQLGDELADDLMVPSSAGDRFARYQQVAERLAAHSRHRPVLVVIDDLHWADADSLRLLAFLAVQLRAVPVTVAATCRDTEPRPELAEALATLSRRHRFVRHVVGPLTVDDVAGLAVAINGEAVTPDDAARLHERTAGNPFLVGELLRLPAGQRPDRLPGGVRDVVERRLASLPDESRSVLTLAALVGRQFDVALLQSASGVELDRLVDLLDAALARRIVLPADGPGLLRFAHDLLRDTLVAGLGDLRRRRLHARLADALAAMPDGRSRRLTELARHRLEAAPLTGAGPAVDAALAAAARAEAALAFDEAVGWYQAATSALEADPSTDEGGGRHQELLLAGARAMALAGRVLPWRAQVATALRAAIDRDDMDAVIEGVRILVGGGAAWLWSLSYEDPTEVIDLLEQTLGRLHRDDAARRSRVIAALAQGVYYRDGVDRAAGLAGDALGLARQTGDPQLVADALLNLAQCLWGADRLEAQFDATAELLALPPEVCTVEHQLAARAIRTTVFLIRGDLAGADAEYATFVSLADRHRRRGVLSQLAWYPATRATIVGDFDRCDALMDDARRLQQSLEVYLADLIHAGATAIRGYAADDLEALPDELVATLTAYSFGGGVLYPGLLAVRRGDLAAAGALLEKVTDFPHRFRDWLWLADMVLWAELAATAGNPGLVAAGLEALRPYRHLFAVAGTAVGATGPVAYAVGRLELAAGDRAEAAVSFRTGLALARSMGAKPWIERGEALLALVPGPGPVPG